MTDTFETLSYNELYRRLVTAAHDFVKYGEAHKVTFKNLYEELMRRYSDHKLTSVAEEIIALHPEVFSNNVMN